MLLGGALVGCTEKTDTEPPVDDATKNVFVVDADFSSAESFYDFPFPSDLRLTADGHPDADALPYDADEARLFHTVFDAYRRRPKFSVQPAAYFLFDGALPTLDADAPIAAESDAPVLLVDVDPNSPDRGKLYVTAAHVHADNHFTPPNLLAVGTYPGVVLPPDRTYALVVLRSLGDADGEPLGVPGALVALAAGETPEGDRGSDVASLYTPLWETLDTIGVAATEVAAATLFTTGDVVQENLEQSNGLIEKYDLTVTDLALDPDDGATQPRFCEVHGTVMMPQFQLGQRPYNNAGEALMILDESGVPEEQGTQAVPVVLTIPKGEMPAGGYPLMYYIHGTGGYAAQGVDRGRITEPMGQATKGEGPAFVVAEHGMATFMAAMPFNPERDPGLDPYGYASQVNFSAFPYNFRQGMYEQRLLIEALETLTIDPAVLTGCDGPTLPAGETAFRFNTDAIVLMGQSMGATYANILAAVEPKIVALAPSGSGSFFSHFLMTSPFFGGLRELVATFLDLDPASLSPLHPAVRILSSTWEAGDALPSLPRQSQYPFDGHPVRDLYTPVSEGDSFFPTTVFNAMAMAWNAQQAGDTVFDTMQPDLGLVGGDGFAMYPVADNRTGGEGQSYTSVVVQYPGDGVANSHTIFSQLDEVKYQYGCFLASALAGNATVPAPAALGTPCP